MMPTPSEIAEMIGGAIKDAEHKSPRAQQARSGILGPSDIGFCRQKAVLVTRGVEPSDEKSMWAANVGTAVHNYVEAILKDTYPEWLMGSVDDITVTATLPSGAAIGGHPDIIAPNLNAILDIKTVDGFEWVKREGTSDAHKYQRALYALGAIQEGYLDGDSPVYVGNVYFDRSGKEQDPYVTLEPFSMDIIEQADEWIGDVQYAVINNEDAQRDIPAYTCSKICEFFSVCRGNLPVSEGQSLIQDDDTKAAILMYVDGQEMEKQAKRMKSQARSMLVGVNGTDGMYQVRWTEIAPTFIEGYTRSGSVRLDVVPMGN
jgi:hypothetical protein